MGIYQGSKLMSGGGGGGPSPYEIAKQNGYIGTEQEFNQLLAALDQNVTEQDLNNKADLVNGKVPAEQVDAYTKTEANTLLQNKADKDRVVNPNLLDNWYFGNPVDQRQGRVVIPNTTYYSDNQLTTSAGTTSAYVTAYRYATGTANGVNYASFKLEDSDTAPTYYAAPENVVRGYTGAGYGIDRWVFDNDSGNSTILLTEFGIKFVNSSSATGIGAINQKLPPELYSYLAGKTITISMLGESENPMQVLLLVNGSVYAVNSSRPDENNLRVTTLTATLPETISGLRVYVYGASKSGVGEGYISAAKLELGTQQTLAHQENGVWVLNEIPNYGEQLARCQRYYQRIKGYGNAYSNFGAGYFDSATDAAFFVPISPPMRTIPSVSYSATNSFKVISKTNFDPTALSVNTATVSTNGFKIVATVSGATAGDGCILQANSTAEAFIELSADL